MLRPAHLLPPRRKALDAPLGRRPLGRSAGACYQASRHLPGRIFHPLARRSFQDAPPGDLIAPDGACMRKRGRLRHGSLVMLAPWFIGCARATVPWWLWRLGRSVTLEAPHTLWRRRLGHSVMLEARTPCEAGGPAHSVAPAPSPALLPRSGAAGPVTLSMMRNRACPVVLALEAVVGGRLTRGGSRCRASRCPARGPWGGTPNPPSVVL